MARKFESKLITISSASAGDIKEIAAELDSSFDRCKSIQTIVVADGGDPNFRIGLKQGANVLEEANHQDNWQAGTAVPIAQRAKSTDFKVSSNDVKLIFEFLSDVTNAKIDFTFELVSQDEIC